TDTVLADFGQGGVFVGQKAVAAGLADRVSSYEAVLATLTPRAQNTHTLHAESEPDGVVLSDSQDPRSAADAADDIPVQDSGQDTQEYQSMDTNETETRA